MIIVLLIKLSYYTKETAILSMIYKMYIYDRLRIGRNEKTRVISKTS